MAEQKTPRAGLTIWTEGTDDWPGREATNAETTRLDSIVALYDQGTTQDRPEAGIEGRHYWDETEGRGYYDDGTAWRPWTRAGGGGLPKAIQIGGTGATGTSTAAAPWDHVHAIPFATRNNSGAMSREFAMMLEDATSTVTANTIPIRGSGGQLSVGAPTAAQHAATKAYVDQNSGGTGGGTILADPDTVPRRDALNATFRVGEGTHPSDVMPKSYIDGVGSSLAREGVMRRNAAGQTDVANPSHNNHALNLGYLNSRFENLTIAGSQVRDGSGIIPHNTIGGSSFAWSRTGPTTSTWATCVIDSAGRFSRYGSSLRVKENIRQFILTRKDSEGRPLTPLQAVRLLQGVVFDYIGGAKDQIGFIGDDVLEVVPELVIVDKEGVQGLHYELFVVLLVEAIQELLVEIEEQQRKNEARFARIEKVLRWLAPDEFEETS